MLKKLTGILCTAFLATAASASAQGVAWRFGGIVQAGAAFHTANFHNLPGILRPDTAPPFGNATGLSYGAGGIVEWPVSSWFSLGAQADMQGATAEFLAKEAPIPSSNGEVVFGHIVDYSALTAGVQPFVALVPLQNMSVRLGLRLGVPVWSSFEQWEQIVDASPGLEYLIGSDKRLRGSGNALPGAPGVEAAVEVGVGYDIALSKTTVIRPGLSYRAGLADKAEGVDWKTGTLQAGVALFRQMLHDKPVRIDTLYQRDTTVQMVAARADTSVQLADRSVQSTDTEATEVILRTVVITEKYMRSVPRPAPLLTTNLNVRFVLKSGEETEGVRISIETILERSVVPVLPYLFFEPVAAELPSRYSLLSREEAEAFAPEQLDRKDVLAVYRNVLNIVGQRLQRTPTANLVITGANSGEGEERRNIGLSQERAETIRSYLVNTWGIDEKRLAVRAVNLPPHPSNSALAGGIEENRRVELSSDDSSILAPVYLQDTVRVANPPVIRFYPQVLSEAGVEQWQIALQQGERFSKVFADSTEPPEYIDWNIDQDRAALISADAPMQYSLYVRDVEGGAAETEPGSIVFQVRQKEQEAVDAYGEVTRYSLIVFDYDGAALTRLHRTALDAIRESIPAGADVSVVGMTDELGDEEYNRALSERRAQVIAAALQLPSTVGKGIGEQSDISSATPEGRFYSRRVDVLVRRNAAP